MFFKGGTLRADGVADYVGGAFLALRSLGHGFLWLGVWGGYEMSREERYRQRAEELRVLADGMQSEVPRNAARSCC